MKTPLRSLVALILLPAAQAAPVPVTLAAGSGLQRAGQPYFIKGVGGEAHLKRLAGRGANSIRTWSTNGLDKTLDDAERNHLTVSAGIWLESECSWFSYQNPEHCARQTARVKSEILRHRDHPALLAWWLGNEAEGDGTNAAYWQQIGRLAAMAREIDPAHLTFTALAGINPAKADGLNRHAPQLDFVGVNTYGGLFRLRKILEEVNWTRPWVVTEWGPQGFWERPRGVGGMALEQTSTEKAAMITKAYAAAIAPAGRCLGSYAFVWGWKFEATSTWFGLLTHDGKTTSSVDALQQIWTGKPASNTAPSIQSLIGIPATPVAPGTSFTARDAEGDSLTWHWSVLPEAVAHSSGATLPLPPAVPDTIEVNHQPQAHVKAPTRPGRYRVHVEVSDGQGQAANANAPLLVQ